MPYLSNIGCIRKLERSKWIHLFTVSKGERVPISTPYYTISQDQRRCGFHVLDMSLSTTV